jgi:hypothetical protein
MLRAGPDVREQFSDSGVESSRAMGAPFCSMYFLASSMFRRNLEDMVDSGSDGARTSVSSLELLRRWTVFFRKAKFLRDLVRVGRATSTASSLGSGSRVKLTIEGRCRVVGWSDSTAIWSVLSAGSLPTLKVEPEMLGLASLVRADGPAPSFFLLFLQQELRLNVELEILGLGKIEARRPGDFDGDPRSLVYDGENKSVGLSVPFTAGRSR